MFAYKGSFDGNTATGNQTISGIVDENSSAFTPKAVIVWTTGTTAAGFANGWVLQLGFSDGTTTGSAETTADDNVATQRTASLRSATRLVELINAAGTVLRAGTLSSFGSGQFVINWTTAPATSEKFHYLALGGTDLDVAFTMNRMDQLRTTLITGVSDLSAIIFGGAYNSGAGHGRTSLGWTAIHSDGTIEQGTSCPYIRDNVNPSQCQRYQRTDRCRARFNSGGGSMALDAFWDQIGMALPTYGADSNALGHDLLLGGIATAAGNGLQPTSTGTQAITGLGFSPKCVLIMSVGAAASTSVQNGAAICIGAADRTRQGYAITGAGNGVTPSVTVSKYDLTNAIAAITPNATAASTTTDAEASIQSIDSDGFTLNWATADATQRQYLWLALGDAPAAAAGERSRTFVGSI